MYRLIYHYRDELEYRWLEMFEQQYGFMRREVLDAFDRYLSCGVIRHGAARARCGKCNHSTLIAFSCKRRGVCVSCQAKRGVLFAEHLNQVLLRHPHRHIVFSIPKRLRIYFRYDRSLFKLLYRAAWDAWREYVQEHFPHATTGSVLALHTAGDLLNWHPHIHAIVLDGAVLDDGHFLELPNVDLDKLQRSFEDNVFRALLNEELISIETIESMRTWSHSGFNVYTGDKIQPGDDNARLFLARYLRKAPLSETRLSIDEAGIEPTVVYRNTNVDAEQIKRFSPLEFLAQLSLHIPDTWEQTTRHYGVYSSATRGKKIREEKYRARFKKQSEPLDEPEEARPASASFARCMKLVFEIDPLECPRCGEQMKIISFLQKEPEIEKIASNLGMPTWRAPPKFAPVGFRVDTSDEYSQSTH